ncbi:hypothetical protein OT109_13660 [Phycisphaeraceae bacterium D3-23]
MKRFSLSLLALMLMTSLVGCGGSSVSLPESAITEDCYAIQWFDTKAMSPDMAKDMIRGIADDMSDDQPKARLWMSARADMVESSYEERWDAFTEAGGIGFLRLHYVLEKKGEGDDADPTTHYRTYVLIRVKKSADIGDLEKAIKDYVADDNGNREDNEVKLEKVDGEEEWYWLTTEGRPEGFKLPEKKDEDALKAFNKLIGQTGGAPAYSVWRTNEKLIESLEKRLDDDEVDLTDDEEARLKEAVHLQSVVMAITPGPSPSVEVSVTFDDKEYAKTFAEEHNDGLSQRRAMLKQVLMGAENPPHPSVVDRLVEQMEVKPSGATVSISMNARNVKDGLAIRASQLDNGGIDTTTPGGIFAMFDMGQPASRQFSVLRVPSMPGSMGVFGLSFNDPSGRDR